MPNDRYEYDPDRLVGKDRMIVDFVEQLALGDTYVLRQMVIRFVRGYCVSCGKVPGAEGVLPSSFEVKLQTHYGDRYTSFKVCDECRERIMLAWGNKP